MNRTVVFVTVAAMVTVISIGVIVSHALGRDVGPIIGMVTASVTPVIGLVPILLAQQRTHARVRDIAKSVNGNTSRLLDVVEGRESDLSEETIQRIRADDNKVRQIAEGR